MFVKSNRLISAAMLNLTLLFAAAATCLTLATALPASAQQASGAITGTVLDPLDAAIPHATVTVRDLDQAERPGQQRPATRASTSSRRFRSATSNST